MAKGSRGYQNASIGYHQLAPEAYDYMVWPGDQSNYHQKTSKTSYVDKPTGKYDRVTNKEVVSAGETFKERSTGRVGYKDEYKTTYTHRVGDKTGYTEYQVEERFRNVNYGVNSSSNNRGNNINAGWGGKTALSYDPYDNYEGCDGDDQYEGYEVDLYGGSEGYDQYGGYDQYEGYEDDQYGGSDGGDQYEGYDQYGGSEGYDQYGGSDGGDQYGGSDGGDQYGGSEGGDQYEGSDGDDQYEWSGGDYYSYAESDGYNDDDEYECYSD